MSPINVTIVIISGGQTGVDRAALDAALDEGVDCAGWCPRGRLAEDGRIPEIYPLLETDSDDVSERTMKNVDQSDATLILHDGTLDDGTALTIATCASSGKPLYEVDLSGTYNTEYTIKWINDHKIKRLNVAGPRESSSPGIYRKSFKFMKIVLKGF